MRPLANSQNPSRIGTSLLVHEPIPHAASTPVPDIQTATATRSEPLHPMVDPGTVNGISTEAYTHGTITLGIGNLSQDHGTSPESLIAAISYFNDYHEHSQDTPQERVKQTGSRDANSLTAAMDYFNKDSSSVGNIRLPSNNGRTLESLVEATSYFNNANSAEAAVPLFCTSRSLVEASQNFFHSSLPDNSGQT